MGPCPTVNTKRHRLMGTGVLGWRAIYSIGVAKQLVENVPSRDDARIPDPQKKYRTKVTG
jgi:hypothetical protein